MDILLVECTFLLHRITMDKKKNVISFLQLKKLGVMPPEQPLPLKCYRIYQIMWANNGDTISRQYAGTAALKVKVLAHEVCHLFMQQEIWLIV